MKKTFISLFWLLGFGSLSLLANAKNETMSGADYNIYADSSLSSLDSDLTIEFSEADSLKLDPIADDSLEEMILRELIHKTDQIIEEKNAEKQSRLIVSCLVLIFVLLSIWNRKQKCAKEKDPS